MGNLRKPSGYKGRGGGGRGGGGRGATEEPLHAAARAGDLVTVQSICCSDPLALNSRDRHSRTPLHLAAWSGDVHIVSYLCKNNADVGAAAMDDMGAIHFASQKGHLEVVRILLSSGVSVKATNRKGFTPLHYAVQGSHLDLAKYLVKKGASIGAKTKAGKTPLNLAESNELRSFLEECEKQPNKEDASANLKSVGSQEGHHHTAGEKGNVENKTSGDGVGEDDERCEMEKRKGDETDVNESEAPPIQKKPRVALNHLITETDMQDEQE